MQNPFSSIWQVLFLEQGLIDIAYKIIAFMDISTLLEVIRPCHSFTSFSQGQFKLSSTENSSNGAKKSRKIIKMIQVYCFLKQYLNVTDRSMYYSFYEEQEFVCISKQLERNIVINQIRGQNCNKLGQKYLQIQCVFEQIQEDGLLQEDQLEEFKRILADPSLPLPPLKRQNQGIYCSSSFQLFLVGLRFPHCAQEQFTPFEELKQKIADQEDSNFKQFFSIEKQKHSLMKLYENLHLVRYMPYEITTQNYKTLMLEGNTLHNFLVSVFAVTDIWIEAIFTLINAVEDPFYKLSEMMSRYAVFRSYVIELEESLGFLFRAYENIYSDTIRDSLFVSSALKPKYCFWRPALAKWFLKMSPIHEQTNDVYFMLLTKLREEAIVEKLETIKGDNQQWKAVKKHQIVLRNGLEMNEFSREMRQKIYQKMTGSSVIEEFISNNPDTCDSLVFQYVEYFIDLAVNEETVHWCGHSNHRLEQPFNIFNDEFAAYNNTFLENLKNKALSEVSSKQAKKNILQLLIQCDLEFLETKNVKPIMLKSLVSDINLKGKFFEDLLDKSELILPIVEMKQIVQEKIEEEAPLISEEIVCFDFGEKDEKLKYFNEKAKICESIEGEDKCFFSIPPLLSPQEILMKSINTNDTSENEDSDANSSFEYVSDNESEELNGECECPKFGFSQKDIESVEENMENLQNTQEKQKQLQICEYQKMQEENKISQMFGSKKQVRFQVCQKMQEQQSSEMSSSQNEKKTLNSTNSSSKQTQGNKNGSQIEKCEEEQEFHIVKSQSI